MTDITNRQIIGDGATWACNTQFGAPQMTAASNANGQLLQVLDAVLVDGFNSQTATGAELLPDGFVKIKFGTAVDYRKRQKLLISGANDANLNGEHVVTQVIGNDVVIKAPDVSILTGAIKTKVAPLGWESIFGSTAPLKRAYRSKNPNSTQTVMYLDMTLPTGHGYNAGRPAHRAMVSICEDMTELGVQIGSYTDVANNYAQHVNGSLFWYQARGITKTSALQWSTPNEWTVVGNGDYFYFMPAWVDFAEGANTLQGKGLKDFYCFGDFPSLAGASDNWSCAWAGSVASNDIDLKSKSFGVSNSTIIGANASKYYISSYSGNGSMHGFSFYTGGVGSYYSGAIAGIEFPNATTQSMLCEQAYTLCQSSVRGVAPRLLSIKHSLGKNWSEYDNKLVDNFLVVSLSGSIGQENYQSISNSYFAFDMGD